MTNKNNWRWLWCKISTRLLLILKILLLWPEQTPKWLLPAWAPDISGAWTFYCIILANVNAVAQTQTSTSGWIIVSPMQCFLLFFLLQKSRVWLSMPGLFYCPVTMMIPFLQGPIPVGSSHYNPCSEETTLVEVLQSSTDSQIQTRRCWDKQTQTQKHKS